MTQGCAMTLRLGQISKVKVTVDIYQNRVWAITSNCHIWSWQYFTQLYHEIDSGQYYQGQGTVYTWQKFVSRPLPFMGKREVPRDVRNSKIRRQEKLRREVMKMDFIFLSFVTFYTNSTYIIWLQNIVKSFIFQISNMWIHFDLSAIIFNNRFWCSLTGYIHQTYHLSYYQS